MLDIRWGEGGEIVLAGRFDASQADKAEAFLDAVHGNAVVNMRDLQYISSLGLGVLIKTQKRLRSSGAGLRLAHLSPHLRDIFGFAGFDKIFEIDPAQGN